MSKKVWIGALVVFVVIAIWEFLVHAVLLKDLYMQTAALWRPEAEMKMGVFYMVYAIQAFFFTLIFSKGYEGKGVSEGIRYGILVGVLMAVGMGYGTYGAMPIPYALAMQWFLYGVIEFLLAGIAVAIVFGKNAMVVPVAKH